MPRAHLFRNGRVKSSGIPQERGSVGKPDGAGGGRWIFRLISQRLRQGDCRRASLVQLKSPENPGRFTLSVGLRLNRRGDKFDDLRGTDVLWEEQRNLLDVRRGPQAVPEALVKC
jgi:hypothetical protein